MLNNFCPNFGTTYIPQHTKSAVVALKTAIILLTSVRMGTQEYADCLKAGLLYTRTSYDDDQ